MIFKTKLHPDGTVNRYKAHLVAKGYNQVKGVHFFVSFSPMAKFVTVSLFFAIPTARSWPVHQPNINNSFLHGFLDEEVYRLPPPGNSKAKSNIVYLLRRSLYDLKQASCQWNIELSSKLHSFGFQQSCFDPCLFFKRTASSVLALLVYVDDVLFAESLKADIIQAKHFLHSTFTIKDMGLA